MAQTGGASRGARAGRAQQGLHLPKGGCTCPRGAAAMGNELPAASSSHRVSPPRRIPSTGYPLDEVAPLPVPCCTPHIPSCAAGKLDSPARAVVSMPLPPGHGLLLLTKLRLTEYTWFKEQPYIWLKLSKRGQKSFLGGPVPFHCEADPWSSTSRTIKST